MKNPNRKSPDEYIGLRFGRLVIESFAKEKPKNVKIFNVLCDCGKRKEVRLTSLQGGHAKSCGCLLKETRNRMGRRLQFVFKVEEV